MPDMKETNLPNGIKRVIDNFLGNLKDAYGESLVSVTLYGSAAIGEHGGSNSNINIAVVLKDASLGSLSKALSFINKREFSTISPVFLTEDYIRRSTDVFPIEFLDMKENHIVLYGKDVFSSIVVDIKNLRFQCEHELKSKMLNIKKLYLRVSSKRVLRELLFRSLTSTLHILRNLVRLEGRSPAYSKGDIIDEVSALFGIDVSIMKSILDAKNGNLKLNDKEIYSLFSGFVDTLEKISDKVDALYV